jgi:hypothetical protein
MLFLSIVIRNFLKVETILFVLEYCSTAWVILWSVIWNFGYIEYTLLVANLQWLNISCMCRHAKKTFVFSPLCVEGDFLDSRADEAVEDLNVFKNLD